MVLTLGKGHNKQAAQNIRLQNELVKSRLDDEDEDEDERDTNADPPEPPQLEDTGDSDSAIRGALIADPFETHRNTDLPFVTELPQRLRPPVRYRVDSLLQLHFVGRQRSSYDLMERAVAEAVLIHVTRSGVRLTAPGDWLAIPCLNTAACLADLAPAGERLGKARLGSVNRVLNNFAIELPSGDVITPLALIAHARENKRTTRAAALRLAGTRPEQMPTDEKWDDSDWNEFERAQAAADTRARRAQSCNEE